MPYAPAIRVESPCGLLFISGATPSPLFHKRPHVIDEQARYCDKEFFRGLVLSVIAVYIMLFTGWKGEEWYSARPYRYDEVQR
jgi:hypothetical protein